MTEQGVQEEAPDMFSDMLAFPSSKARSPQDFVIKFSGSGDLKASVTRPSGIEDDAEVVETGRSTMWKLSHSFVTQSLKSLSLKLTIHSFSISDKFSFHSNT